MCEELEKCYGTDGILMRAFYRKASGTKASIPEYKSYDHARQRCTNPKHVKFYAYGGKGIEFKFNNFTEWWDVLGKKPSPEHTVDRIDGKGNYEAGNVRWASPVQQATNRECVRSVRVTYPDGSQAEFPSSAAATRSTDLGKDSIRRLCKNPSRIVKGYKACYIPKLNQE